MDFASFAISNGLLIKDLSPSDRIRRCGTHLHPNSRNGAYYFDGFRGWCQNWETSGHPSWWKSEKTLSENEKNDWAKRAESWKQQRRELSRKAAFKAQERIDNAYYGCHPYMESKGLGNIYTLIESKTKSMIVPMRNMRNNSILGLQEIYYDYFNRKWMKKMQYGMTAKGAVYRVSQDMSLHGIYCEGYATGMSIVESLKILRIPFTVTICFSADNLLHVASYFGDHDHSIIFADNDSSGKGQSVAAASGYVWTMPEREGQDANDVYREDGPMAVLRLISAALKEKDRIYGKKYFQKGKVAV